MIKYFKTAQFISALILFACTVTGFVCNIFRLKEHPEGIVVFFIGIFLVYMSFLLVREAYKEIKRES
jgi:hypothetical protein